MSDRITLFTPSEDPAQDCKNASGVIYEASYLAALEYRDNKNYAHAHNLAVWLTREVPKTENTLIALAGAHAILAESHYSVNPARHADLAMGLYEAYEKFIPKGHTRREIAEKLFSMGKDVMNQVKKQERAKRRGAVPDIDEERAEKWKQDMDFWRSVIRKMPFDQTRITEIPQVDRF